jgi:hypothetical protein
MTAHVAEAGENRGRVLLQSCSANPSRVAILAAIRLARAFNAEIESLFIEDRKLIELAQFPFAREVGLAGRNSRSISADDIASDLRRLASQFHRTIEGLASAADIASRRRDIRDDPLAAVSTACTECGPWNVVALADPFSSTASLSVGELLDTIADVTGVIMVGPQATRHDGPIVLATESAELLPGLLRTADRISALDEAPVRILLVSDDANDLADLELQARLALSDRPEVAILPAKVYKTPSTVIEALRRELPGLILARFGGFVVPSEDELRPFASALECPLLLVR